MKLLRLIVTALLCASVSGDAARLSPRFRTVYVLKMSNALDQHLANRLSNAGVLWVVLDPASADAVITDSIDAAFFTWLQRTYPTANGGPVAESARSGAAVNDVPPAGEHRGTIFLVDPRKRVVLWSTYELPRNASPLELDRAATRITIQLKSAFGKK
jgi:hypothetical protein